MSLARRQRPTLSEPARELISRVTEFQPGTDYYDICSNYVALHLFDVNGMGGVRNKVVDREVVDNRITGLAEKISLNGHDSKAEALKGYLQRLRRLARSLGGGDTVRMVASSNELEQEEAAQNVMSSLLLVLLELSDSPTTLKKGENVYTIPDRLKESKTKPKSQEQINREIWMNILKEDPLVGEHWQSNLGGDQRESDGSDFEDMDVNPRVVPNTKDVQLDQEGGDESIEPSGDGSSLGAMDLWMDQPRQKSRATTLLKVFERHQYWRGNAVTSKKYTTTPRIGEFGLDIQRSSDLNAALQQSRKFMLAQSTPVMDEVDVIHEYSNRVAVSHLSPGALDAILQPFLESAREISDLQMAVDAVCSAPTKIYGKVIQAFASAMSTEILELKVYLADKQKEYQHYRKAAYGVPDRIADNSAKQVSANQDAFTIYSPPNNGDHACSFSTDVLSGLYDNICKFELSGDSDSSSLFLRLLQQSIKPFLLNVECWLSGQPLDSESEFLIQNASNVDLFASEFWTDGCYVQSEIVEQSTNVKNSRISTAQILPCFLSKSSLDQMLYTGKAIRIVQALLASEIITMPMAEGFASTAYTRIFGKDSSTGTNAVMPPRVSSMDREFPNYNSILSYQYPLSSPEILMSTAHPIENSFLDMDYTNAFEYRWRMESELTRSIEEQYQYTNSLLKSMLFKQSLLLWHLKGMAEFNFMMQGEVMHLFSKTVFDKMLKKRPWYDGYVLGSTFIHTASLCDWKHAQFVRVRLNKSGKKSDRIHISGLNVQDLDQIEFEYQLPWPLAGIIYSTENANRMYSRITCLLFQVKTVKHAMDLVTFLKSKPKPSPELRLFWKLRLMFLSTMNDLWSYLMTTVLDVQIKKFQSEIEGQCDLDDMINLSDRFILLCYERCFLKERTVPLHRSLITMLNLVLKFSALFSTFIHEQERNVQAQQHPVHPQKETGKEKMDYVSKSGRRVSFNNVSQKHQQQRQGVASRGYNEDFDADSEDETLEDQARDDEEDDEEEGPADKKRRGARTVTLQDEGAGNEMDEDEDLDMDSSAAVKSRAKKQKISSELWRATSRGQRWSQEGSYQEQLKAIEQEFNRCREFLAKSLRIIVNSNAARGNTGTDARTGQSEGDSNYLDGLILALSS
ncbi:hypothetical protein BGX27_006069 [Mortierella sp. AM989]|nr:hypothetical protein BGX27_006069 [Mortierella sp. AM989]